MQKIMLFLITFIFLVNAKSQITKGNWLVGGNAGFASTTYNSEAGSRNTGFTIQIAPDIGYFIAHKFATGLKVGFGKEGYKATGTSVYSTYIDAKFGPFLRYYFLPADNQLNILIESTYQYGFEKGNVSTINKNTYSLSAGPVVYFNTTAGLEFLIGYSSYKYVGIAGSNGSVQVGLGLQVHLERDK